jgi:hypothetical protein
MYLLSDPHAVSVQITRSNVIVDKLLIKFCVDLLFYIVILRSDPHAVSVQITQCIVTADKLLINFCLYLLLYIVILTVYPTQPVALLKNMQPFAVV